MSRFVDRQAAVDVQPNLLLYWVSLAACGRHGANIARSIRAELIHRHIDIAQVFGCTAIHVYDRPAGAEPLLTRDLEEGVLAPGDRVAVCLSDDGRTLWGRR